jgi:hypothetical protein
MYIVIIIILALLVVYFAFSPPNNKRYSHEYFGIDTVNLHKICKDVPQWIHENDRIIIKRTVIEDNGKQFNSSHYKYEVSLYGGGDDEDDFE